MYCELTAAQIDALERAELARLDNLATDFTRAISFPALSILKGENDIGYSVIETGEVIAKDTKFLSRLLLPYLKQSASFDLAGVIRSSLVAANPGTAEDYPDAFVGTESPNLHAILAANRNCFDTLEWALDAAYAHKNADAEYLAAQSEEKKTQDELKAKLETKSNDTERGEVLKFIAVNKNDDDTKSEIPTKINIFLDAVKATQAFEAAQYANSMDRLYAGVCTTRELEVLESTIQHYTDAIAAAEKAETAAQRKLTDAGDNEILKQALASSKTAVNVIRAKLKQVEAYKPLYGVEITALDEVKKLQEQRKPLADSFDKATLAEVQAVFNHAHGTISEGAKDTAKTKRERIDTDLQAADIAINTAIVKLNNAMFATAKSTADYNKSVAADISKIFAALFDNFTKRFPANQRMY